MSPIRTIALLLLLLPACVVRAQPVSDSLRAYYIEEFPDRFAIWPVLKYREFSFNLRDKDRNNKRVSYQPNNAYTLGVGGYLFDLVIEAAFAIPLSEKSQQMYGESSASDLQANILGKQFAADVYYQRYRGFYVDDREIVLPPGTPFPQRPDIATRNFGLGGLYLLNHRKFSLRSAFNYVDRQLNSRGSVVVGGGMAWSRLEADSAVLLSGSRQGFGDGKDFRELRSTSIYIGGGYSYTFVWRNFFLNGTMVIGPAHNWIAYNENERNETLQTNSANLIWRVGLGYNGDRLFGGIGYSEQSRRITFSELRFSSASSLLRIVIGYRFNKIGILRKRAADLVPGTF